MIGSIVSNITQVARCVSYASPVIQSIALVINVKEIMESSSILDATKFIAKRYIKE